MKRIAVLFARADSVYKALPGCDVFDAERDARTFGGGMPVIAHPPCRAWAGLRHLARPRAGERELAVWAVDQVRTCGGVLEHPARSQLWVENGLPPPGKFDASGGWTFPIMQSAFGHRADKPTLLYICGLAPRGLPQYPLVLGQATHIIGTSGRRLDGLKRRPGDLGYRPEVTKAEREHTPRALAEWLVQVARLCTR